MAQTQGNIPRSGQLGTVLRAAAVTRISNAPQVGVNRTQLQTASGSFNSLDTLAIQKQQEQNIRGIGSVLNKVAQKQLDEARIQGYNDAMVGEATSGGIFTGNAYRQGVNAAQMARDDQEYQMRYEQDMQSSLNKGETIEQFMENRTRYSNSVIANARANGENEAQINARLNQLNARDAAAAKDWQKRWDTKNLQALSDSHDTDANTIAGSTWNMQKQDPAAAIEELNSSRERMMQEAGSIGIQDPRKYTDQKFHDSLQYGIANVDTNDPEARYDLERMRAVVAASNMGNKVKMSIEAQIGKKVKELQNIAVAKVDAEFLDWSEHTQQGGVISGNQVQQKRAEIQRLEAEGAITREQSTRMQEQAIRYLQKPRATSEDYTNQDMSDPNVRLATGVSDTKHAGAVLRKHFSVYGGDTPEGAIKAAAAAVAEGVTSENPLLVEKGTKMVLNSAGVETLQGMSDDDLKNIPVQDGVDVPLATTRRMMQSSPAVSDAVLANLSSNTAERVLYQQAIANPRNKSLRDVELQVREEKKVLKEREAQGHKLGSNPYYWSRNSKSKAEDLKSVNEVLNPGFFQRNLKKDTTRAEHEVGEVTRLWNQYSKDIPPNVRATIDTPEKRAAWVLSKYKLEVGDTRRAVDTDALMSVSGQKDQAIAAKALDVRIAEVAKAYGAKPDEVFIQVDQHGIQYMAEKDGRKVLIQEDTAADFKSTTAKVNAANNQMLKQKKSTLYMGDLNAASKDSILNVFNKDARLGGVEVSQAKLSSISNETFYEDQYKNIPGYIYGSWKLPEYQGINQATTILKGVEQGIQGKVGGLSKKGATEAIALIQSGDFSKASMEKALADNPMLFKVVKQYLN